MSQSEAITVDLAELLTETEVLAIKTWRDHLDVMRRAMDASARSSRELSLAITKIEEARMWLGMELKRLNDGVSCYSHADQLDSKVDVSQ